VGSSESGGLAASSHGTLNSLRRFFDLQFVPEMIMNYDRHGKSCAHPDLASMLHSRKGQQDFSSSSGGSIHSIKSTRIAPLSLEAGSKSMLSTFRTCHSYFIYYVKRFNIMRLRYCMNPCLTLFRCVNALSCLVEYVSSFTLGRSALGWLNS
jgi:hypothetical protein